MEDVRQDAVYESTPLSEHKAEPAQKFTQEELEEYERDSKREKRLRQLMAEYKVESVVNYTQEELEEYKRYFRGEKRLQHLNLDDAYLDTYEKGRKELRENSPEFMELSISQINECRRATGFEMDKNLTIVDGRIEFDCPYLDCRSSEIYEKFGIDVSEPFRCEHCVGEAGLEVRRKMKKESE